MSVAVEALNHLAEGSEGVAAKGKLRMSGELVSQVLGWGLSCGVREEKRGVQRSVQGTSSSRVEGWREGYSHGEICRWRHERVFAKPQLTLVINSSGECRKMASQSGCMSAGMDVVIWYPAARNRAIIEMNPHAAFEPVSLGGTIYLNFFFWTQVD